MPVKAEALFVNIDVVQRRLKGKTVSTPGACFKPVNMKKRFTLARTKAKMGARMKRKAKMTKRMNPASKRLKTLNRR